MQIFDSQFEDSYKQFCRIFQSQTEVDEEKKSEKAEKNSALKQQFDQQKSELEALDIRKSQPKTMPMDILMARSGSMPPLKNQN